MPRIFSSEHTYSYKNYTFGYAVYAERLRKEAIDPIYAAGFLPYSGEAKSEIKNLYYMARSARVVLKSFMPSSENRRIMKKFSDCKLSSKEHSAFDFIHNDKMLDFCLKYFETRHGTGLVSKERLQRILGYSHETKVIEYKDENSSVCAYIIEIHGKKSVHYWFSFYDLSLTYQSFGMWLMLDRVKSAKENGKEYCYLGTVYGDKALYKTNIPSLEYWNGETWTNDIKSLRGRAKTDDSRVVAQSDEFKI